VPETREVSLFALGTAILQRRWRIMRWAGCGAVLAALLALTKPTLYRASASFAPQGNEASRAGLAELAGQFGLAMGTVDQSLSPDFYADILRSRELLGPVARDTFQVTELGGRRVTFLDLFKVVAVRADRREELGIKMLRKMVTPDVTKSTGVVLVSVETRWPSVSLQIVTQLIAGVNHFNQRTRQSQAAAERDFLAGRLASAGDDLQSAEDHLEQFLRANRQLGDSPQLMFENERLRRELSIQQQLYTTLTQAYEDARMRAVRDTPVITIVEAPAVSSVPEPRGRIRETVIGMFLGGLAGLLLAYVGAVVARARATNNEDVELFFRTLSDLRHELSRVVLRRGREREV
jgi:uncharacterized protein involved in exopolysaccharide biosynthesis